MRHRRFGEKEYKEQSQHRPQDDLLDEQRGGAEGVAVDRDREVARDVAGVSERTMEPRRGGCLGMHFELGCSRAA